jgi:hypothetical protein
LDCNPNTDSNGYGNNSSERNSYSYSYSHGYTHGRTHRNSNTYRNCDCHFDACHYADCAWLHGEQQTKSGPFLERGVFEQGRHLS